MAGENNIVVDEAGNEYVPRGGAWVNKATGEPFKPPADQTIAPENKTISEMKGLGLAGGTGLLKGAADVAGVPGDVESLARAGLDKFMPTPPNGGQQQPVPTGRYGGIIDALNGARGAATLPTSAGIQQGMQNIGIPFHEPQGNAEKIVEAGGEAAPFGMLGTAAPLTNMLRAAGAGAASEAAGQATQGSPWETPARIGAGLAAYGGSGAFRRPMINANSPVRAAAQGVENAGVRVPASTLSGNRLLATAEGGRGINDQAVGDTIQRLGNMPRPAGNTDQFSMLVNARRQAVQQEGNQLAANTSIPAPVVPALRQQLSNVVQAHTGQFGGASVENPAVDQALKDYDQLTAGGQPLTGAQYQRLHQTWSADRDTYPMAQHLDAAMDHAHPGVWDNWRDHWADVQGMAGASEPMGGAATAHPLSPDAVVQSMQRRTPMRNFAENAQTVKAAQPKPYDLASSLTGLGALLGTAAGGAYHGGIGASELGLLGTIGIPPAAATVAGVGGPLFRHPAVQNMIRNLDPRVVSALLAQQGVIVKGGTPEAPPSQ